MTRLLLLSFLAVKWYPVVPSDLPVWDASPALLAAIVDPSQIPPDMPKQVHIAVTKKTTEMSVTWLTFEDVPQQVDFRKGSTSKQKSVKAETTKFVNHDGWTRFIHRAVMTDLTPGETYAYQVGRPGHLSKEFEFMQLPLQPPYNILVFGDLGIQNGESIPALLRDAGNKMYDLIVNVGDMAYDLFSNNGTTGDQYWATMEPLFATVPYMCVAGNHEAEESWLGNFTTYRNSVTMPDEGFGDNQFYSFDVGPIHFVALSSEFYAFHHLYGVQPVLNQYEWLATNKNRKERPWIASYFHRPFYCSNSDTAECSDFENHWVREGVPKLNLPGLEQLIVEQGVDFSFWGHEHSYERFYPRAPNYTQVADPYYNPAGPIYVISGSAGCHSGHNDFGNIVEYSAARIPDFGYSRMFVPNATHIRLEQYSAEKDAVVDSVWIVKDKQTKFETV